MDGTTLEHLDQITGAHQGGVNDLALNQDGSLLASAGVDGLVRVWDVATRSLLHQIPVSPAGDGGRGRLRGRHTAFAGHRPGNR